MGVSVSAWSRRVIGVSTALALLVAAVLLAASSPDRHAARRVDKAAGPQPAAAPAKPAHSTASSSSPSPRPNPSEASVTRRAAIPEPGITEPGITEPGIDLRFSARADGGFDVSERIILRAPRPRIRLTPPGHAAAGVAFANSRARVRSLQIQTADGQPLAPERLGTFSGATTIPLGAATSALVLRYQLDGTSVRSVPSTAGRALAFIRPLTADVDPTLPVRVSADGPGTLNLSCPQLPVDRRACAQGTAPELRGGTAMTAAESVVVVQLNLPAP